MANPTTFESSLPAVKLEDPPDDEEIIEEEIPPEPVVQQTAEELRRAEIEARARRDGWKPLSEWRGDPREWRSAEEFVNRGSEINSILRRKIDKQEQQLTEMGTELNGTRLELEKLTGRVAELLELLKTADKQGYERAKKELQAAQRRAAAEGNLEQFDQIQEQIDRADEERVAAAPVTAPKQPTQERPRVEPKVTLAPEVQQFMDDNSWFMTDPVLNAAMREEHRKISEESPGLSLAENLSRAKERVVRDFPKKFGIEPAARTRTPPAPARGGARPGNGAAEPGAKTGIDTIEDPAERAAARRSFDAYRANDPDATEEAFMAIYNDPKADVLDVQRQMRKPAQQQRRAARG